MTDGNYGLVVGWVEAVIVGWQDANDVFEGCGGDDDDGLRRDADVGCVYEWDAEARGRKLDRLYHLNLIARLVVFLLHRNFPLPALLLRTRMDRSPLSTFPLLAF